MLEFIVDVVRYSLSHKGIAMKAARSAIGRTDWLARRMINFYEGARQIIPVPRRTEVFDFPRRHPEVVCLSMILIAG